MSFLRALWRFLKNLIFILLGLVAWVASLYGAYLIVTRVPRGRIVFDIIFIVVALIGIALVTISWVVHNVNIYRRKGPRRSSVFNIKEEREDKLGRRRILEKGLNVLSAPYVIIEIDDEGRKIYKQGLRK